jgi:hypothetical protein
MLDKENKNKYQIKKEKDRLIFRTAFFKAEKTSVLHTGVYTKEFASILFASAICITAYMFIEFSGVALRAIRYVVLVLILMISFLIARKYIFKEKYLEVIFDKSNKTVNIIRRGIITKKLEKISFENITSVDLGNKRFVPENIDGIDFVQKISAQHGSPVPGLGDVEEFITLSLSLTDGSERMIFAAKIDVGRVDGEPEIPVNEIRSFLGNQA